MKDGAYLVGLGIAVLIALKANTGSALALPEGGAQVAYNPPSDTGGESQTTDSGAIFVDEATGKYYYGGYRGDNTFPKGVTLPLPTTQGANSDWQ